MSDRKSSALWPCLKVAGDFGKYYNKGKEFSGLNRNTTKIRLQFKWWKNSNPPQTQSSCSRKVDNVRIIAIVVVLRTTTEVNHSEIWSRRKCGRDRR